ncbi:MAG: cytochrome c3 family protein [Fuerstiella sp.]
MSWAALCVCLVLGCSDASRTDSAGGAGSTDGDGVGRPTAALRSDTVWPPDDRRDHDYTGSQQCAECHAGIDRDYFGTHPMGQSVKMPDNLHEVVHQSLPTSFETAGRRYSAEELDGGLIQAESMNDQEGEIYRQTCAIDFAIGSGQRGYTFVTQRGGCLYQAPLTWYSQKSRWDLSPGYDPLDHPRFGRQISDGCIACHAGRPDRSETASNQFRTPVFLEATIGCERCHGPGQQHIAVRSGEAGANVSDTIVNPSKLDPARRDSVCYQCHLHGRGRILRKHRTEYDFRPGDRLSDIWVTFVDAPDEGSSGGSFKAVSQVEQMIASRCYQNSEGRLGCISCHDPHRSPMPAERLAFYRQKCLNCHQDGNAGCSVPMTERRQTSAEDSCIKCHMPAAAASDVPHTAQTDHRVLRTYTADAVSGNAALEVFDQTSQPLPQDAVQRAFGLKLAQMAVTRKQAADAMNMLAPFIQESPDDLAVLSEAAWLLFRLGDLPAARRLALQVLDRSPEHTAALETLAVAAQTAGDHETALQYIDQLLSREPFNLTFHQRRAETLLSLGRMKEASDQLYDTLAIDPLQHPARQSLIRSLSAIGLTQEADAQTRLLERIQAVQKQAASEHVPE